MATQFEGSFRPALLKQRLAPGRRHSPAQHRQLFRTNCQAALFQSTHAISVSNSSLPFFFRLALFLFLSRAVLILILFLRGFFFQMVSLCMRAGSRFAARAAEPRAFVDIPSQVRGPAQPAQPCTASAGPCPYRPRTRPQSGRRLARTGPGGAGPAGKAGSAGSARAGASFSAAKAAAEEGTVAPHRRK